MSAHVAPPVLADGHPVEIRGARYFDFISRINDREYRLYVAFAPGEPPPEGFPVVYMFDGDWAFGTAVETLRGQANGQEIRPAVLVGIGYPTRDPKAPGILRFKDLSTPVTQAWMDSMPIPLSGVTPDMCGGVDAFLQVLEHEIKPAVAALTLVNPADQILVGHSLGGLAVLRALFTRPAAFRTFVASSPSIWWNDKAVLEDEAAFTAAVTRGEVAPRIFVDAGGLEQTPGPAAVRVYQTLENARKAADFSRMVDNAAELGARLAAVKGPPGYEVETVVFPDEGHLSVIPAAVCRGLRFALRLQD